MTPAPQTSGKLSPVLRIFAIVLLISSGRVNAAIPAVPVMTLYQFNGALDMPYYSIESFQRSGAGIPAGRLAQGTSMIPCLVIRNGLPLTDHDGTPYVGFEIVVDSRKATPASTEAFKNAFARQKDLRVQNHHCGPSVQYVIDVRYLFILSKAPFFDPEPATPSDAGSNPSENQGPLDEIIREFHASSDCRDANRVLLGRRGALSRAWEGFIRANQSQWPKSQLERAKHLDYTLRTAIYESHLDRGCNAYGACERNIIALSIRNRGRESCAGYQGCRYPGDFQGVASIVSQYNIWDEYLTQITGLSSCFLRPYPNNPYYEKIGRMYRQNVGDVERILFGGDNGLSSVFADLPMSHLKSLRHYYHAPAMGKCFPDHPRVEYMSGAVAKNGADFALIANTRIEVDGQVGQGYRFREFILKEEMEYDEISIVDNYPGFIIDGRKVELRAPSGCTPYGIPRGCSFDRINRYRKTPSWLSTGQPLELRCRLQEFGEDCQREGNTATISVGGSCDTQMRPVRGVP
ncbi:MAG: hypothetical protein L0Y38_04695 [Methylococcaceae bacterium]|nr:hypothetical protein [Methylococcaceae bacterium]